VGRLSLLDAATASCGMIFEVGLSEKIRGEITLMMKLDFASADARYHGQGHLIEVLRGRCTEVCCGLSATYRGVVAISLQRTGGPTERAAAVAP